jgi:DNA repair exonuclease SbcCD ATPase subunit
MQESFDKLQILMKSKVDKVVSDKLDLFYNKETKESKEHEEILFDKDCIEGINGAYHRFDDDTKEYLKKSDKKCFSLYFNYNCGYDNKSITMYYLKKIIIYQFHSSKINRSYYNYHKHNFTTPVLFVLKNFAPQENSIHHNDSDKTFCETRIDLITEHPEYFQNVNSSDFEEICRKEYNDIEEKKVKLENLIQDYTNKKEYYESLERQVVEARLEVENIKNEYAEKYNKEYTEIEEEKLRLKNLIEEYTNNKNYYELIEEKNNDFEKEQEELQKEKEKIIIEKEKITFIKQKLLIMKEETILMKSELQREKEKLLEYKKNTNDIDEYFDEMINQFDV